jgi:hypothetical protein
VLALCASGRTEQKPPSGQCKAVLDLQLPAGSVSRLVG